MPHPPDKLVLQTIEWPLRAAQGTTEEKRLKRQSLRVRPSEYLDNAEPPLPLRQPSLSSNVQPNPARMSLFNLFSRPKVEKQRGYAERALDVPAPLLPASAKDLKKSSSTPNLLSQRSKGTVEEPPLPSPTPTAFAKAPAIATPKLTFQEPPKPTPRESKTGPFEPPPLFQAYPQSTKDGTLELSTLSVEAAMHKSKGRKGDGTEEDMSIDTKRTRGTLRHGHHTNPVLPRKVFVLITTGYLLQYAENGPANRLPERILKLGKDSAAFASDLLPGRHHVLQVSHAVDKNGVIVPTSSSILSKFGIRSLASRRMTSGYLLVMDSAAEMESWMTAIRRSIEGLGGQKIDPDPVRPSTRAAAAMTDLKKTPSHRYQVKRNPSKVDRLASPVPTPSAEVLGGDLADTDAETATIDGIEMEASKLDDDEKDPAARQRALSDAPSISSSAAVSVEQGQLNGLRKSESNSARTSHTSQATTVTSPGTSQASSVAGSPPAEKVLKEASAVDEKDASTPPRSSFRPLSSYSNSWRRSGVPLAMQKSGTLPPAMNISPSKPKFSTIVESPDPSTSNSSSTTSSPKNNLTVARSEPNLGAVAQAFAKSELQTSPPPSIPPPVPPTNASANSSRRSIVNPSWQSSNVPTRRTSLQPLASQNNATQLTSVRTIDAPRNKRMSFSMPLKVNPSGVHANTAPSHNTRRDSRRSSQLYDPDAAGETPAIHTLSAKVDPSHRLSNAPARTPTPSEGPRSRLSLLAEQPLLLEGISSQPTTARLSSSSSPTHLTTQIQAQGNGRTLRRPTSLQVRSDPAPFLTSVRNSQAGPTLDARAIPIRGMKPSRSASNVAALAAQQSESSARFASRTPTLSEEGEDPNEDKIMPLPDPGLRSASPLPPRPGSRTSVRRGLKTRSSLPELDFGIPVVGLGPPAPPPSAPLPAPPPEAASRAASPNPVVTVRTATPSSLDGSTGLGIRV